MGEGGGGGSTAWGADMKHARWVTMRVMGGWRQAGRVHASVILILWLLWGEEGGGVGVEIAGDRAV